MKKLNNLKVQAKSNLQVSKGTSKNNVVLKEGIPNDHSPKRINGRTIGMSIGSTINMQNYESLRVDVWLTDTLEENESLEHGYDRIRKVIDKVIGEAVNSYTDD